MNKGFIYWLFKWPKPPEYYLIPCANNRLIFDMRTTTISVNYDNPEVLKGTQDTINKFIDADLMRNKTR